MKKCFGDLIPLIGAADCEQKMLASTGHDPFPPGELIRVRGDSENLHRAWKLKTPCISLQGVNLSWGKGVLGSKEEHDRRILPILKNIERKNCGNGILTGC